MKEFDELVSIMKKLRSEGGCVWDREQTHETLLPFIIEESHELIDALESGDKEWEQEELGDLLLQVIFHCQVEEDENGYTIKDVLRKLCDKLIFRHPHVFGTMEINTPEELEKIWEEIKKKEKALKKARREVRTMSPMFRKNVAHVLSKKRRFFEEKIESDLDSISEYSLDLSDKNGVENLAGNLILKGMLLAFKNGIEPERAVWNAVKQLKYGNEEKED